MSDISSIFEQAIDEFDSDAEVTEETSIASRKGRRAVVSLVVPLSTGEEISDASRLRARNAAR